MRSTAWLALIFVPAVACTQLLGNEFELAGSEAGAGAGTAAGPGGAGGGVGGAGGAGGSAAGGGATLALEHTWSHRYGGPNHQIVHGLAVDANDQVLLAGHFVNEFVLGGTDESTGGTDAFMAKLDDKGQPVWARSFTGNQIIVARDVAADAAGNAYALGYFSGSSDFGDGPVTASASDVFLVKRNANGGHMWSRTFTSPGSDIGFAMATNSNDTVAIAGDYGTELLLGGDILLGSGVAMFVGIFDAAGNHVASRGFSNGSAVYIQDIALDDAGNVYVAGDFQAAIDFGNTVLNPIGAGGTAFLAKLDSALNEVWAVAYGSSGGASLTSLSLDGSRIAITGVTDGPIDFGGGTLTGSGDEDGFVAVLDDDGGHQLSWLINAPGMQRATGVTWLPGGLMAVGGVFSGAIDTGAGMLTPTSSRDLFMIGYDTELAAVSAKSYADAMMEPFTSLAPASDGLVVGLTTSGVMDLGGGPLSPLGSRDLIVAKLR